jgi:hypothetical protein
MASLLQRGTTINRDKFGVITLTVNWVVDTLEETMSVGASMVFGLPETGRNGAQMDDGKGRYKLTITYAGSQDDSKPNQERWSGRLSFREEPIESHPQIMRLMRDYEGSFEGEGSERKVVWPEFLKGSDKGSGFSKAQGGSGVKNPMFGARTYPVLVGEITHSYQRKQRPADLLTKVGKVLASLPSGSGLQTPSGYCWVTQLPEWDQQGGCWKIDDHYMLTPKEGYVALTYNAIRR